MALSLLVLMACRDEPPGAQPSVPPAPPVAQPEPSASPPTGVMFVAAWTEGEFIGQGSVRMDAPGEVELLEESGHRCVGRLSALSDDDSHMFSGWRVAFLCFDGEELALEAHSAIAEGNMTADPERGESGLPWVRYRLGERLVDLQAVAMQH